MEIEKKDFFHWPILMRGPLDKRDKNKYYEYHRDHGRDTEDCRQLKYEIENLIQKGQHNKYVGT